MSQSEIAGAPMAERATRPDIDPCDDDGVDRSQIRAFLALSPAERLERASEFVESILEIRARNDVRPVR